MNSIITLFNIDYPIIQAGMIWASGWKLASAVSNAGGLGVIGAGSMYPDTLREHIQKCKTATTKPFGVNVPLLYPDLDKHIQIIIEEGVKIVFTSAGNPKTWTQHFKQQGITVVHVVSSSKFALKAQDAGCDAVVAEGFKPAGTTVARNNNPGVDSAVAKAVSIPVIAAGGIATGKQMLAAMVLGARGVQIGTRFVASEEASSHLSFKQAVVASTSDTQLTMKKLTPVRLLKNKFFQQVQEAEARGADETELKGILGRGRAKQGMYEGNLEEGELEIGQVSALVKEILPAGQIVKNIWNEFNEALKNPLS